MRVVGEAGVVPVTRTPPGRIALKEAAESRPDFIRGLGERDLLARALGRLDGQAVSVEVVVPLQGLDDEEVEREPDRASPVRIAAEEGTGGLAGNVVDAVLLTSPDGRVLAANPAAGMNSANLTGHKVEGSK